jgi:cellobiose phosphorylase
MKKYGYFSEDGLEFVITTPTTPRPWINYLTNEKYCLILSHCAGGYSFYKDCRSDRVTRWLPESWHFDRPGRYLYIKSKIKNQKSKIWSATYQPLRVQPDFYECRHGLGYTVIKTEYNNVLSQITFFVSRNDDCEVWLVRLSNKSRHPRTFELYPYIEWLLGDYHLELRYRNIMNLYNRVWFDEAHQAVFAKKTAAWGALDIQPFKHLAFFASSLPVKGYVTRKASFLGRYNTEEKPKMVLEGNFHNVPFCSGEDGVAVFRHSLRIEPGKEKEFVIVMGQTQGASNVKKILSKYRQVKQAHKELELVKQAWRARIADNIIISTPDKDFDTMMNIWVKYQLYICNLWSRSPSFYHEGSGGRGYRDSCQDSESIVSINSRLTRKRILKLAGLIRKDGTCAPGWADTTGPAKHLPNKDHPIWLTSTVSAYIKETGDKKILFEKVSYLKDRWVRGWDVDLKWKKGAIQVGSGTILEHLERNLNFTFTDVGKRGLPLIGHADWNDAIDAAGIKHRGESVWLAQALVRSLRMLAELCSIAGKDTSAKRYLKLARQMQERIDRYCWDGSWYKRGFTDDGTVYGSKVNKEGKIYLNTQSWAILADMIDSKKLKKILASVEKYLDGPHGLALFWPAYSKWNSKLGRISMFSEGTKENAAVFCHAVTFMVVAYLSIGEGRRAYEAMRKIMPNAQADYDLYQTEPYVYAEYLVGPGHPYLYGEGAFTWITGTAGWTFMAATEWMLGARRDYEGLRIDPCIPGHWRRCSIRRPFRGAIYEIEIENPQGKEHGVKEIYVDGDKIEGNLIKPHQDGRTHKVKVIMG